MAENSSVKKTSRRATINFPIGSEEEASYTYNSKRSKKRRARKTKKAVKGLGFKGVLLTLLVLVLGVGIGIGSFYLICKKDEFTIRGEEEITITLNDKYSDEGVNIVAFGKNIEDKVVVNTNLKIDENGLYHSDKVGTFYIIYSTNELKYGSIFKVQKIRLITVVEPSEEEEKNSANEVVVTPEEGSGNLPTEEPVVLPDGGVE